MTAQDELAEYYETLETDKFEKAILEAVFSGLSAAQAQIQGLDCEPFDVYVDGTLRHVSVSRSLEYRFKQVDGWAADYEHLKQGGYPVLIARHKRLILTASQWKEPDSGPKRGAVREQLAHAYAQLDLFKPSKNLESVCLGGIPPCGQIMFFPRPDNLSVPGVLQIGFPDNEYKGWLHKIDVLRRQRTLYEQLVDGIIAPTPEEMVPSVASRMKLKDKAKENV